MISKYRNMTCIHFWDSCLHFCNAHSSNLLYLLGKIFGHISVSHIVFPEQPLVKYYFCRNFFDYYSNITTDTYIPFAVSKVSHSIPKSKIPSTPGVHQHTFHMLDFSFTAICICVRPGKKNYG